MVEQRGVLVEIKTADILNFEISGFGLNARCRFCWQKDEKGYSECCLKQRGVLVEIKTADILNFEISGSIFVEQ